MNFTLPPQFIKKFSDHIKRPFSLKPHPNLILPLPAIRIKPGEKKSRRIPGAGDKL
jgi:hypothetical protein